MTDKELVEFLKRHDIIIAKTRTELKKLKMVLEKYRNDPLFHITQL